MSAKLEEVFQSASNGKKTVAGFLTEGGVTTDNTATFETIKTNIGTYGANKYNQGVTDADNRSAPGTVNYNSGYNKGVVDADNRVNTTSASYSQGKVDASNAIVSQIATEVKHIQLTKDIPYLLTSKTVTSSNSYMRRCGHQLQLSDVSGLLGLTGDFYVNNLTGEFKPVPKMSLTNQGSWSCNNIEQIANQFVLQGGRLIICGWTVPWTLTTCDKYASGNDIHNYTVYTPYWDFFEEYSGRNSDDTWYTVVYSDLQFPGLPVNYITWTSGAGWDRLYYYGAEQVLQYATTTDTHKKIYFIPDEDVDVTCYKNNFMSNSSGTIYSKISN